ncbi:MAG TPA: DUF4389 domain-containing protein [Gaiellaceae bacterium]|nr:DUF4389 domain-containing protein [Gaiellaceae bacterium]
MASQPGYPLRLDGRLEGEPSRWLWLVKWLLAIPHYIVLVFLWIAFFVLTVVAFFAILFTARYPRGIFDFNLGVLRWTWRVAFYSYGALGTDRYPPFSLGEEPDYPATLDVAYPERLSRGLVLVKWWLLAIPHYLILGLLLGGGSAAGHAGDWHWGWGHGWVFSTGLIGLLVLFAAVALLFTTRYPRGLFDLVLGFDRWVARVVAYAGLMTDAYPPFRLDQGGDDPAGGVPAALEAPAAPPEARPAALAEPMAPTISAAQPPRGRAGRIALIVVGILAALLSLGFLAGGGALVVLDQTQRDSDGFLMSPSEDFSTATYAIVSDSADVDFGGSDRAARAILGDVRIRSESTRDVFVGIGRDDDVDAYLDGVEHSVVTRISDEPEYSHREGGAPGSPPDSQGFWAASTSGVGEQTLEWEPEEGSWSAVVMNSDGSRGVASELSIGAELDAALWVGIAFLAVGAVLATLAALAITAGTRRRA